MQIYFFLHEIYDYFVQDHLTFLNHVYDVVHVHMEPKPLPTFVPLQKKEKGTRGAPKGLKHFK